ncbi:flippase [Leptothermofonsia sichuanensis E412]|uniref:flippase n=1 Tax=Leptothermofonsia sichuanensis TaxID=2917832 RepID=UPI001CA6A810|nr:flippase [Leptothermofonsia sichuanensis]QZZ20243.1 flippase [Leptothermofonsia sichuanensis E412]
MNQSWIQLLPPALRSKLDGHYALQKIIGNTGWLFADRILRMGVGLVVGVWVARFLGPNQFGLFNYAVAFTAIFGAIASLGLDSIAVREIVRTPEHKDQILGTTFVLRLIGSVLVWLLTVGVIILSRPNDGLTQTLVGIIAAGAIFQAGDTIDCWFQSQIQSKYTVTAKNIAFTLIAGFKIVLIQMQAPLVAFAWAGLAEIIVASIGLAIAYQASGNHLVKWRFSLPQAKQLLKDGSPLILSSLMIMIYMRVDQVMLAEILGEQEVGFYSAAVRLAEVWYFIPTAIVSSTFPSIIEARQVSETLFFERLQVLYRLMASTAYLIAIPTTLLSGWIIHLLFGNAYEKAGPMLAVLVWASLFVNLGVARSSFLTAMNWTRLHLFTVFLGCLLNIGLNILLIPIAGGVGAAIATCISYWFAVHGTCFLCPPLTRTGTMLTKAMLINR